MHKAEFVALIAMMFATIAFSVDAMLPALPRIGMELAPENPTSAALILTSFLLGMGLGTFVVGPISDAFGRKNVVFVGIAIYIAAAAVAWQSQTMEVMLAARLVQGLGAAAPRVVAVAIIRDLFSGREMAKLSSLVMMIFTLIPAFAPAMGAVIILYSGWRAIFLTFILFTAISVLWMAVRLPETLPKSQRRPLRLPLLWDALRQIFAHPKVRLSIMVQTLCMATLFTTLMLIQQIYDHVFDRADSFPYWFGAVALLAGSASILNALLVVRYGMQRLVTITLGGQIVLSSLFFFLNLGALPEPYGFGFFLFWQTCLFFQAGLTLGNLNALAMEPMGHIAGMAASVVGALSSVMAALIASPVALLFDGMSRTLIGAVMVFSVIGFALMVHMARVDRRLASRTPDEAA